MCERSLDRFAGKSQATQKPGVWGQSEQGICITYSLQKARRGLEEGKEEAMHLLYHAMALDKHVMAHPHER